ncbi:DUF6884 domain-containing protein [Haloarchaeobius amylolyticus]|uniref:DUF6884 domain-containing protein n=1 Tax=Haloarchaeobius amylolyticus TaxID=1198296 RepID=UPI0034A30386
MSCGKSKRDEPAQPKDLYIFDYFTKMRTYAEQNQYDSGILCREGVLRPTH